MDIIALGVTGVALSMDAVVLSVISGAADKDMKGPHMLRIAAIFGIFQAAMPLIGWLAGVSLHSIIGTWEYWITFVLLLLIAGKCFYNAVKGPNKEREPVKVYEWSSLLAMGVATSIDAFVAGVVMPVLIAVSDGRSCVLACIIIGAITFLLCAGGLLLGKKRGLFGLRLFPVIGGALLAVIGATILIKGILT